MKVYQIEVSGDISRSPEAKALYQAAEKVFDPAFRYSYRGGHRRGLCPDERVLLGVYKQLEDSPFSGPACHP